MDLFSVHTWRTGWNLAHAGRWSWRCLQADRRPVTGLFSVGGDEILFLRSTDGSQVWKTRFEGGVERPLDPAMLSGLREGFWTVARDSIYFLRDTPKASWQLWRYELASGKLEILRRLAKQHGRLRYGIGVRP